MKLPEDWNERTRFLEVGTSDEVVASHLARAGFSRFAIVCESEGTARRIARDRPDLAPHIAPSRGRKTAWRCSTDVLILSGDQTRWLRAAKEIRHVQYVAFAASPRPSRLLHLLPWLFFLLRGRYELYGSVVFQAEGRKRRLILTRVRKRRTKRRTARFIPHTLGVEGFFEEANARGLRYAVLRWSEDLPDLGPKLDVDVLVADDDLEAFGDLLEEGPGVIPIDVYSVSGLGGSQYLKMAYYPPDLARRIVESTALDRGRYPIPATEVQFLSLAYHALYHKGAGSGLPTRETQLPSEKPAVHDYGEALRTMAAQLDLPVEITMESLDDYLNERGWRPPLDTLSKLALDNRWLATRIAPELARAPFLPGLSAFIIRKRAVECGLRDRVLAEIEKGGFEILRVKDLDEDESRASAEQLRGGNWIAATWNHAADPPAVGIAAYSLMPLEPTPRHLAMFPHLSDARLLIKSKIREKLTSGERSDDFTNVIHGADNPLEAEHYLDVMFGAERAAIERDAALLVERFATKEEVVRNLTRKGVNAKVELIRSRGELAVKKTFRPSQRGLLEREVHARVELGKHVDAVPEILEADDRSIVMPYCEDTLHFRLYAGRLLPREIGVTVLKALRRIYELGYAHLDAHPENIVVDARGRVNLLDYEYLHRYECQPDSFEASWDMAGRPADFVGPMPRGLGATYARVWEPSLGLSLQSALGDPPWLQHSKRLAYRILRGPILLFHFLRHHLRRHRRRRWARLGRRPGASSTPASSYLGSPFPSPDPSDGGDPK